MGIYLLNLDTNHFWDAGFKFGVWHLSFGDASQFRNFVVYDPHFYHWYPFKSLQIFSKLGAWFLTDHLKITKASTTDFYHAQWPQRPKQAFQRLKRSWKKSRSIFSGFVLRQLFENKRVFLFFYALCRNHILDGAFNRQGEPFSNICSDT